MFFSFLDFDKKLSAFQQNFVNQSAETKLYYAEELCEGRKLLKEL